MTDVHQTLRQVKAVAHGLTSKYACVPLSYMGRSLRLRTRPVYSAFREGLRFRQHSLQWSDDRKREWMLSALRTTVRHASRTTVFYRDWLDRAGFDAMAEFSFEDFARLPILERRDLREAGMAAVNSSLSVDQLHHDATGGSTGVPTEVWSGPVDRGWAESGSEFFMRRIGLPAGSRIGLLWGHHLDPVQRSTFRDHLRDWWFNNSWYDCFRLSSEQLRVYHSNLQQRRPDGLVAYASALASLAEFILEEGPTPIYPSRALVTGAEKLFAHQRDIVTRAFQRPVHERYGARDAGLIGFQVHPNRSLSFELDWANKLVEPATDGDTSDILVTKLHADGMPMLRYRIGDIGQFPAGTRPGRPALVLEEVLGRDVSRLWLPGGKWVHGLSIPHLMKGYPVKEFQVIQRSNCAIEVRLVPTAEYTRESGEELLEVIGQNLPGLPISLEVVAEIPRTRAGKWHPVVSEAQPSSVVT